MSGSQLTPRAFERLTNELEYLSTVKRVELANTIEIARQLGDLSENGDYHAAKDEQGTIENRIRTLQATLQDAEIVEVTDDGTVQAGTVVKIRYVGDDDHEHYLVGHIEERTEQIEVLTPTSPLGQVLLGRRVEERVTYTTPTGASLEVDILEVTIFKD
jgi:transcription elongation factor GreA